MIIRYMRQGRTEGQAVVRHPVILWAEVDITAAMAVILVATLVEQVKEQLREHLENHPALNILRQDDLHM